MKPEVSNVAKNDLCSTWYTISFGNAISILARVYVQVTELLWGCAEHTPTIALFFCIWFCFVLFY